MYFQRVSHSKELFKLIIGKTTDRPRECQNNGQGTQQPNLSQLKGLPGSATIKITAKEYHNQKDFREYYN